jgi:hypothetical protein
VIVAVLHRKLERLAFEQDADAVDVVEVGAGRQRHANAAMAARHQKTFTDQPRQRFAQRADAAAVTRQQFARQQRRTGREGSGQEIRLDLLVDLFGNGAAGCGAIDGNHGFLFASICTLGQCFPILASFSKID